MVTPTAPINIAPEILTPEAKKAIRPSTHTNAVVAMDAVKFRIPADHVGRACKDLPDDQRSALMWLHQFCLARNMDKDQVAALLKKPNGDYYSYDSIYQTLTGRRESAGSLANMVEAIDDLRKSLEGARPTSSFIETRLSKAIFEICHDTRKRHKISSVVGDSNIGKTRTFREYRRQFNHGDSVYVDIPSSCGFMAFQGALANGVGGIPEKMSQREARRRFFNAIDGRMLLIFDNVQRAFRSTSTRCLNVFDFIQELHEATGAGIILGMTDEGRKEMEGGVNAKRLEQITRRHLRTLQLPNVTPDDDLGLFAASFGLPPAPDELIAVDQESPGKRKTEKFIENPYALQKRINNRHGLGVWLTLLTTGAEIAELHKRPMSWGAVLKAYCLDRAAGDAVLI